MWRSKTLTPFFLQDTNWGVGFYNAVNENYNFQRSYSKRDISLLCKNNNAISWVACRGRAPQPAKICVDWRATYLQLGFCTVPRGDLQPAGKRPLHGKAELFRFPIGWFFRYCGGVPVD